MQHYKRKTVTLAATLCASLLVASQTSAQEFKRHNSRPQTFTDYARVVHVDPIYKKIAVQKPYEECRTEYQEHVTPSNDFHETHRRNTGQTIIGGLVGGVIGNQIGSHAGGKRGRVGGTIAGAIIGSAIANEAPQRHRRSTQSRHRRPQVIQTTPVQHCTTQYQTHYEQTIQGYRVTYSYHGQQFTTQMKRDPGNRIPVEISIKPLRG